MKSWEVKSPGESDPADWPLGMSHLVITGKEEGGLGTELMGRECLLRSREGRIQSCSVSV